MKNTLPRSAIAGLTLPEVLVIIAVVAVLGGLLLPSVGRERKATSTMCVNHLKQLALAELVWANDHGDTNQLPSAVPSSKGGFREIAVEQQNLTAFYRALSNEMNTPKILACPGDRKVTPAEDFETMKPSNISYFLNIAATATEGNTVLHGDAKFSIVGNSTIVTDKVMTLTPATGIAWVKQVHGKESPPRGNVAHADGSVSGSLTSGDLKEALFPPENGSKQVRLLFP